MKYKTIALLLVSCAPAALAKGAESARDFSGIYLGGGIASGMYHAYDSDDYLSLFVPDFSDGQYDTAYRFNVGYMFNRIVGIEANYAQHSEYHYLANASSPSFEPNTYSLMANIGYTWNNGLRFFGLAGVGAVEFNQQGNEPEFFDSSVTPSVNLGIGLGYTPWVDRGVTLRVTYDWATYFAKPDADVYVPEYDSRFYKLRQVGLDVGYQF